MPKIVTFLCPLFIAFSLVSSVPVELKVGALVSFNYIGDGEWPPYQGWVKLYFETSYEIIGFLIKNPLI